MHPGVKIVQQILKLIPHKTLDSPLYRGMLLLQNHLRAQDRREMFVSRQLPPDSLRRRIIDRALNYPQEGE